MRGDQGSRWPTKRLGEVVTIARDTVHPSEIQADTEYLGLEDISGETGVASVQKVGAGELRSGKFAFSPKHVLYGKLRPNLGKVARPTAAGICSTDILPLLPSSGVDRDYLYHWLRRPDVVELVASRTTGVNLPRIAPQRLLEIEIPIPPLAEQRRIATLLDRADAVRRKREESRRLMDELLRSVFLEMFGDPVRNDRRWRVRALDGVVVPNAGVKAGPFGSSLTKAMYTSEGYRVYGQEQVLGGDFSEGNYFVSEGLFQRLSAYAVAAGDVLISLVGSFGRVLVVPDDAAPGIINPRLLRIRPDTAVMHPAFLAALLAFPSVQLRMRGLAHGGTMGVLNARLLKALEVVVPPLPIQERFAGVVAAVNRLVGRGRGAEHETELFVRTLSAQLLSTE